MRRARRNLGGSAGRIIALAATSMLAVVAIVVDPGATNLTPDARPSNTDPADEGIVYPPISSSPAPSQALGTPGLQTRDTARPSSSTQPTASRPPRSTPGTGSDPDPQAQGGCPDPRTCDTYRFINEGAKGWRPDADGITRIRYWINPKPPLNTTEVSAEQIEEAILTAADIWMSASPSLRLLYQGRTTREPMTSDGYTDFALGIRAGPTKSEDGYIVEADITRSITGQFTYDPCRQADNSCTHTGKDTQDVLNIVVHELGHVLGLGDINSQQVRLLTMHNGSADEQTYYGTPNGDRNKVTLGLGDILGIREIYPCGCPLPRIYVP